MILLGDIGGTNARFALAEWDPATGQPAIGPVVSLPVAAFSGLAAAAGAAAARLDAGRSLTGAWFAVAGPVDQGAVRMTNHPWQFSEAALGRALGLATVRLVNDFAALARALPALRPGDLEPVGGGCAVTGQAKLVLGPGTGLGVAGLVPCGGNWAVVTGEGGHGDVAAASAAEWRIVRHLAGAFGHVSWERVLSGPGLGLIRSALNGDVITAALGDAPTADAPDARAVAAAARRGAPDARRALGLFSAWLGAAAADLALALGARGGVYIGGGVVAKLGGLFDRRAFRARFEAKGRFRPYLRTIPTYIIRLPYPALSGLAHFAFND